MILGDFTAACPGNRFQVGLDNSWVLLLHLLADGFFRRATVRIYIVSCCCLLGCEDGKMMSLCGK